MDRTSFTINYKQLTHLINYLLIFIDQGYDRIDGGNSDKETFYFY